MGNRFQSIGSGIFRFLLCILLSGYLVTSLYSQTLPFKMFTEDDGLPSNYVYRAIQDEKGYIWIATEHGLSRYDGYTFTNFHVSDGLPNNDVFEIYPDFQGRIWLMNDSNILAYIQNDKIRTFPSDIYTRRLIGSLTNSEAIFDESSSRLMIGYDSDDNVTKYDKDSFLLDVSLDYHISEQFEKGKDLSRIDSADREDSLVHLVQTPRRRFYRHSHNHSEIAVRIMGSDSVYSYTIDDRTRRSNRPPVIYWDIYQNEVQYSNNYNLIVFDSINHIFRLKIHLPAEVETNSVFRDKEKNLWIATKNGLIFVNAEIIDNDITIEENTGGYNITHIKSYKDGFIYANNKGSIFLVKAGVHSMIYQVDREWKIDPFYMVDIVGDSLLFAYRGTSVLYVDLENLGKPAVSLVAGITTAKKFLIEGDEMLIAERIGLTMVERRTEGGYPVHDKYPVDFTKKDDAILLTESEGVLKISEDEKKRFHTSIKKVNKIEYLVDQWYFLATDFLTSYICNDDTCMVIALLEDLDIGSVQQDIERENVFWVIHRKGIVETSLNVKTGKLEILTSYPIVQITNCNEVNDLLVEDNRLVVATNKGIYYIRRENVLLVKDVLTFHITDVRNSSGSLDLNSKVAVPFAENDLEIEFSGLSFTQNNTISYRYQLKGVDNTMQITNARTIRYPDLKSGHYSFEIAAFDQLGAESKTLRFDLVVAKPWWLTWGFLLCCILFGIVVLYVLYKRRERKILAKAEIAQKFAELELNALQSQMNPHFVFNAMGSLQNLIQRNKLETADQYIAKFATLMRMFLEGSKHKFVTLQDEIDIVLSYFELEKLRFQEKIELKFINELSDLKMQQNIPANLLQPFIENAINHGLFHKQSNGTITLHLREEKQKYLIEIIDNGVGRQAVRSLKDRRVSNHISRAIGILDDKITALQKMKGIDIRYDIEDLYKNGKPMGTKVIIIIFI